MFLVIEGFVIGFLILGVFGGLVIAVGSYAWLIESLLSRVSRRTVGLLLAGYVTLLWGVPITYRLIHG